ncbi:efflux RND transporter periplasmic adaptor subunit [Candidatus Giovannonibacteria bacterium]|nr:efflux RND transporter periplasmic adaptor subunit [Candidatus Giovannonibacteria bacterium]
MSKGKFLFQKKFIKYYAALAAVLVGSWFYFRSPKAPNLETATVARGDILQEVMLTGKVEPSDKVDLGFDKGGRVTKVNTSIGSRVSAGKILVELYNADIASQLKEAEADLKRENAQLDKLRKGPKEEDIKVSEAKVDDATQNLIDKIEDSFTKADDAIGNKIDIIFSNPRSSSPQLIFTTSPQLESDLESGRILLESRFKSWVFSLSLLKDDSNPYPFAGETSENLKNIKSYLDVVALTVNGLEAHSGLTQTSIDTYKSNVSTARTNINTAINNVSSAVSDLKISERELSSVRAGSTEEEIKVQEANVEKAEANLNNLRSQFSKTRLSSPISGVVSRQDAKVGEIVSASNSIVSVISDAKYKIEANLPEADLDKVKIGNSASITLDAFGEGLIFKAKVISIDPAETVVEGVSTYKVTLEFLEAEEKAKSGLTANINIIANEKRNILTIPQRAITTREGYKFVRILNPDGRVDEIKIEVGLLGSDGRAEIASGLLEGANVVISRESN